jgi:hypothetical protein
VNFGYYLQHLCLSRCCFCLSCLLFPGKAARLLRYPFTEPALSATRFFPFTSFRVKMTRGEGFRALAHRNDKGEGLAMVGDVLGLLSRMLFRREGDD